MRIFLTILILSFVTVPAVSFAYNFTEVINNVFNSVNTGNNGNSSSEVRVYTEVNGEVIEDFQKEVSNGESIDYHSEKEFEGGKTQTQVQVNIEGGAEKALEESEKSEEEVATSSLIATDVEPQVPKGAFDTFRQEISRFIDYVFSIFKFK